MSRFDGYFVRQLLALFGFFTLVLVGVFWISRSVSLFDKLIGGGQSAMVFLEFTALALPTLIRTVMPMAAFGAAVYATNRLNRESELTVMFATGSSPFRLARPVLYFGLIVGLMMAVITTVARPASIQQLDLREADVARDVTAQLLNEGNFMHPVPGVTFYIGRIDLDGSLHDVFLSDRRDPAQVVTYVGAQAFLVRGEAGANLVMLDGMAIRHDRQGNTLSTAVFEDLSYDVSSLADRGPIRSRNVRGLPTLALIFERDRIQEEFEFSDGVIVEELHERISWATICVAVALVGFSALTLGSFSRFGLWPQVLLAFLLLIALEGLRGSVSPMVLASPSLWWLLYLPSALGIGVSLIFLRLAGRPLLRFARRPATG
ncbi:MAG: LPS export ABC transporter permease LptF [Paracoccaceae bacterium]